jgi:hypothetical protein
MSALKTQVFILQTAELGLTYAAPTALVRRLASGKEPAGRRRYQNQAIGQDVDRAMGLLALRVRGAADGAGRCGGGAGLVGVFGRRFGCGFGFGAGGQFFGDYFGDRSSGFDYNFYVDDFCVNNFFGDCCGVFGLGFGYAFIGA